MKKKKLTLNKEKVTKLTKEQSSLIQGGGSQKSTNHDFTCCLCTGGDYEPSRTSCLSTEELAN
ncbi:class I lanthipeptide [Cloacibacterium sp. TD35]|uniref:class I lanthipeptide n=1 Tax=Cloacibacterium sp. TD35 TaxID=2976818 RepID=UPI00237E17BC|nr:class I lanthipeptide [Cloacibacterium sp. TD35]WDT67970.1 class I lanthipeptide [Cloacibacterium sp. TD35]